MPFVCCAPVHVLRSPAHAFAQFGFQTASRYLALDHEPLLTLGSRPSYQEVGAAPPQGVLALDPPATVNNPLEEGL